MAEHELKRDALGLTESVVMGVAGTAPAFSIAATMATLVGAVGVLAPASLFYCGIVMFGIALAFAHLNRTEANAGTSFTWVRQAFGPLLGFLAGWSILVTSAVFMVSGTLPAATSTLALVAPDMVDNKTVVTLVAAGWIIIMGAVCAKGIKLTSYGQLILTLGELLILAVLGGLAIWHYPAEPAHAINIAQFFGGGFTPALFASGCLIALFLYWGWDVTASLTEETKDSTSTSGRGGLWSMLIVVAIFLLFAVLTLGYLTDDEAAASSTNILLAIADKLLPRPWSYLAVIAVMLSTIGTLETSILQYTRTLFAQARAGVMGQRYARLHPNWGTPYAATIQITLIALVLLFFSNYLPTVGDIVKDSISAIGFQVAFYYGLTGLACAWTHRQVARSSLKEFMTVVVWPVAAAVFLFAIAIYSIPTFDITTNIVGIGGIVIGLVPYMWNRLGDKVPNE